MKLYSELKKKKSVSILSSVRLTTVCLLILAVLVFAGTLYQGSHGLFEAKQRFFNSWFVLILGFIPFPALRLIVTVLTVNLCFFMIFQVKKSWSNAGIITIHAGVLLLLSGGALSSYIQQEGYCRIGEGETVDYSVSYSKWELALLKNRKREGNSFEETFAFDMLNPGGSFYSDLIGDSVEVKKKYLNAAVIDEYAMAEAGEMVGRKPLSDIPDNNTPALKLLIKGYDRPIWAAAFSEETPVLTYGIDTLYITLRNKRAGLPIKLTLLDFNIDYYPGTKRPRDFISTMLLRGDEMERKVRVSMNKPLIFMDYTFYQSSYEESGGRYVTLLSVIKNPLKSLPYISSIIILAGLFLHFSIKTAGPFFSKNRGKR